VKQLKPWKRTRRVGVPTKIELDHLLASSAIPFIFPARLINREYFGDGSMRQIAPISSALHLGATRVLVIGVNNDVALDPPKRSEAANNYPSLAQIAGHALDSIFLDSMEVDLERVRRINRLVESLPEETRISLDLRHVEVLSIQPSQSIDRIADRYVKELPWTIRLLLRLIGASHHTGMSLVSYLLSEKKFCSALIELGYQDALQQREEILRFLEITPLPEQEMPQ
jgi:NTE family protein